MNRTKLERWLARDPSGRVAVVIGTTVNALSFLRSLGRRGIPTLVLETSGRDSLFSRYGLTVGLPPARDRWDVWMDVLVSTAQRLRERPVLFVVSDEHLLLVGTHADELEPAYELLIPPLATLTAIIDKRQQYERAVEAGVPIPRTAFPESGDEAAAAGEEIGFPCLLKPYESHRGRDHLDGRKNEIIHGPGVLRSEFERLEAHGVPCMVQEVVPGADDALFGYLAFWGRDKQEIASITKQKLRQDPPLFGDGIRQRTVPVPAVAELSRRFLTALEFTGLGSVEFKYDARDGSYRLIEVNPRTVRGNQLAIAAGVDLPHIAYAYIVEGAVLAGEPLWGVRWVHEVFDLKASWRERGVLRGTGEWIRSVWDADTFAVGAKDDPGPLLAAFGGAALRRVGHILPR